MQILPPRTIIEGEVGGATSIALGGPLIVLSSDNEGGIILHPICLGSDTNGLHDGASSSTKRKKTLVKLEIHL